MKKIIFIGTDTPHRRYFLKEISKFIEIEKIFFEKHRVSPPFEVKSFFDEKENNFEKNNFDNTDFKYLFEKTQNVNRGHDSFVLEYIHKEKIDLAIVFGASKLNNDLSLVLNDFALNIHRGIAEKYRGLDSNNWALYHKDIYNMGVTLHKINDKLDKGDIYLQERTIYPPDIDVFKMRYYETLHATKITIRFLDDYQNGTVKFKEQKETGRYYSFIPGCIKNSLKFN